MHRLLPVFALIALPVYAVNTLSTLPAVQRVEGNARIQAYVVLEKPSAVAAQIPLSSSNTTAATVPASVAINAGDSKAAFVITAGQPLADTPVTIAAGALGTHVTTSFTVLAPPALAMGIDTPSVLGGSPGRQTIKLSRAAAYPGVKIALASSNTSVATVPASVTVPEGQNAVFVTITTKAVSLDTQVKTSAAAGAASDSAALLVRPSAPEVLSIAPTHAPLLGQHNLVAVTLAGVANADTPVSVRANQAIVTLPASVVVRAGDTRTSFAFGLPVLMAGTAPVTVEISAVTVGTSRSMTFTVQGPPAAIAGLRVPQQLTIGAPPRTAQVLLKAQSARDETITLSHGVQGWPSSIVIPAGQTTGSFDVSAAGLPEGRHATLRATLGSTSIGAPVFANAATTEVCDGVDNDGDGAVDEALTAPFGICASTGVCMSTSFPVVCTGAEGWKCDYSQVFNVGLTSSGELTPEESRCDQRDNNCNGIADLDGFPTLGAPCGASGGRYVCNTFGNDVVCSSP